MTLMREWPCAGRPATVPNDADATQLTPVLEPIADRLVGKARPYLLAMFVAVAVRDAARVALFGIGAGLLGAMLMGRIIRSLLVGVPFIDGWSLAMVALLLGLVALAAAAIPARRASALDPTRALRTGG